MVKRGTDQHIIKTHQNPQNMRKQSKYNSFRQTQAGIAQSVEHFTRNEGVEGSSPFSSFYRRREFQEPVVVQVFETPFYLPGKKYSAL